MNCAWPACLTGGSCAIDCHPAKRQLEGPLALCQQILAGTGMLCHGRLRLYAGAATVGQACDSCGQVAMAAQVVVTE